MDKLKLVKNSIHLLIQTNADFSFINCYSKALTVIFLVEFVQMKPTLSSERMIFSEYAASGNGPIGHAETEHRCEE